MLEKSEDKIITKAKPHTIKKFELIGRYVDAWARKILGFNGVKGKEGSKGVIYIDCMSNSGLYYDINDNIVEGTALIVAKKLNTIIADYPGKKAILIFNDFDKKRIDTLRSEIEKADLKNIIVSFDSRDCNDFLSSLDLSQYKRGYNTLLLYDPYQAAINWDAVTPFLNRWGEVIINHMVSDTDRGASTVKNPVKIKKYQDTYKDDIETILNTSRDELKKRIISLIQHNRNDKSNYYISPASFFNRTNGEVYNLIHCSPNIEGIKLYKRVTWDTFGGKSSLKNTHGKELQTTLDLDGTGFNTTTDEDCFYVKDIAMYIYKEFQNKKNVTLKEIYDYLDVHPIFPSDGYKKEIKNELKLLNVTLPKSLDDYVIFE